MVLTLSDTRISPMTSFDTTTLPRFGLPASQPASRTERSHRMRTNDPG